MKCLPEVNRRIEKHETGHDVVFSIAPDTDGSTAVSSLSGARKVAWKHPFGEPVWAAVRILRECGGIRQGICIDIGCGSGSLEVELAKRSELTIIGLDIDPDVKPLFERRIRQAGLQDRVSFVVGDAQQLPFPDDYADLIVSRGTLTFIPDVGQCLRKVDRVLKPSGVAFLGRRDLYTPQEHSKALKITVDAKASYQCGDLSPLFDGWTVCPPQLKSGDKSPQSIEGSGASGLA